MPRKRTDSDNWQITVAGVRRSSRTTDKERAKALETKLNYEAWDAKQLGLRFTLWDQACLDWFKVNAAMKSIQVSRYYSDFWEKHLTGKQLKNVTGDFARGIIIQHRPHSLTEAVPANSTANLYLAFVRKIMRHSGTNFRVQMFPQPAGRESWLTVEQWHTLKMPDDLRQLATFSLATGLREANVMGLQWDWVRGDSVQIPSANAKTGRPYGIPLNQTAVSVIQERRKAPVVNARSVFQLDGRDAYRVQLGRAWKAVLSTANVPHMPYHSLRHTFASWMVQDGVPFEIVAKLGQWKLAGLVHRYSHFDIESLRPWALRLDTILARSAAKLVVNK